MSRLLRVDGYLLAQPDANVWHAQWCAARRRASDSWSFGETPGSLFIPKAGREENNVYFEALAPSKSESGVADLDLAYLQLEEFLPAADEPLDLVVSGAFDPVRLEYLLGVLEALAHQPRHVLPRALLAACELPDGRYGILELGRERTLTTIVSVQSGRAKIEATSDYSGFGFYHIFSQWMELAAEAFAAQCRFDMHHNLPRNQEALFTQFRQAFATPHSKVIQLELESRKISLDVDALRIPWPEAILEKDLEYRFLPPLAQALSLPAQAAGFPNCPDVSPQAYAQVIAHLPKDEAAHRLVMVGN